MSKEQKIQSQIAKAEVALSDANESENEAQIQKAASRLSDLYEKADAADIDYYPKA